MKRPKLNQTLFLCLLFVLLAACAGPAAEAPVENAAEAPVVQAPEATSVPAEAGSTHLIQPSDLPAESINQASDHDSSKTPLAATGGDFLIISQAAASAEWSVAGVQVWQDADKSAGGITPVLSDKSKASHNGFESLLFDAGQGDDTDLAWSRLNPNGTLVCSLL